MNILVTGGAGFIGSHMAKRHLADGHRVVVVDDLSSGSRERLPEGARFVEADIAEADLEPLLREEQHRLRVPPRGADRPAPQRLGPGRRRARQRDRQPQALRGLPAGRRAAGPLRLDRRRALRRARGRQAGARDASDQSRLPLRLRQALDREVPLLLPRRSTASRRRSSATPTSTAPGRTGPARPASSPSSPRRSCPAAHRGSAATASRRATTSTSTTWSRRPPARSSRAAAAPGTWEPESRPRSIVSSSCSRASSATRGSPSASRCRPASSVAAS